MQHQGLVSGPQHSVQPRHWLTCLASALKTGVTLWTLTAQSKSQPSRTSLHPETDKRLQPQTTVWHSCSVYGTITGAITPTLILRSRTLKRPFREQTQPTLSTR